MMDEKGYIGQRLSVLVGLNVSGIGHAADMLTLQFGALKQVTNLRGKVKQVGEWALHIQCKWRLEHAGEVVLTQNDLAGSDTDAHNATARLEERLVRHEPTSVQEILAGEFGNVSIVMSRGLTLHIVANGTADEEDWRFFAPGADVPHLVIEGGRIEPGSLG